MNKLLFHNVPWRSEVALLNTAGLQVLKEDKTFRLSWQVGFCSVTNRQVHVPVYMAIATWKYQGFCVESAWHCSPLAQTSCFQCGYVCWWAVKSSLPQGTKRHPVALSFGNPWSEMLYIMLLVSSLFPHTFGHFCCLVGHLFVFVSLPCK